MRPIVRCAVALLSTIAATADGARAADPVSSPNRSTDDTREVRLPVLASKPIWPMRREGVDFEIDESWGTAKWVSPMRNEKTPRDAPVFATDEDAVKAARAWVETQLGKLPSDHDLIVASVERTASGDPQPRDLNDRGHSVFLRETYRGVPSHGSVHCHFAGKELRSARIWLLHLAPIPATERPVIGRNQAIAAWRQRLLDGKVSVDVLNRFELKARPRLVYVFCPLYYEEDLKNERRDVLLRPSWAMDPDEERLMVDAYTGRAWIDD